MVRDSWVTGCVSGKRMYASKSVARRARRSLKRAGGDRASGLSEYLCDACNHFHVGHLPPHVRRGIGARGDFY